MSWKLLNQLCKAAYIVKNIPPQKKKKKKSKNKLSLIILCCFKQNNTTQLHKGKMSPSNWCVKYENVLKI